MIVLNIVGETRADVDYEAISRVVDVLNQKASDLSLPSGEYNLRLTSDSEIQELNRQFAGNDYPTDVLSFSYIEDGQPSYQEVGDIAVSLETALRQAKTAGVGLSDEVALLTLHGILHIAGYDHADTKQRQFVDKLQSELMSEANLTYRDFKWE